MHEKLCIINTIALIDSVPASIEQVRFSKNRSYKTAGWVRVLDFKNCLTRLIARVQAWSIQRPLRGGWTRQQSANGVTTTAQPVEDLETTLMSFITLLHLHSTINFTPGGAQDRHDATYNPIRSHFLPTHGLQSLISQPPASPLFLSLHSKNERKLRLSVSLLDFFRLVVRAETEPHPGPPPRPVVSLWQRSARMAGALVNSWCPAGRRSTSSAPVAAPSQQSRCTTTPHNPIVTTPTTRWPHFFSCPIQPYLFPGDVWAAPLQVAQFLAVLQQSSDLPPLQINFDS